MRKMLWLNTLKRFKKEVLSSQTGHQCPRMWVRSSLMALFKQCGKLTPIENKFIQQ